MLRPVIAALAALLVLAACGASSPASPSGAAVPIDPSGEWLLVEGTVGGQPLALRDDAPITFSVDGSHVSGRSACNQYFGEFAVVDGTVRLSGLGGTEMACEAPIMALESAYLGALAAVVSARMDGETLVLTGPGVELRFERTA